jgi:hypothetical protein
MNVEILALCDAAVESNGRLSLIGTIDLFWAERIPYVHPKCTLAMRLRFDASEAGKYFLKVQVVDPDGRPLTGRTNLPLEVKSAGEELPLLHNIILDIRAVKFAQYGPHAVHVTLDGTEWEAMLPFGVVSPKQIPARSSAREC